MNALGFRFSRRELAILACVTILVSLIYSKTALTIGMFGLLALALFHPRLGQNWRSFLRRPAYLGLTFIFFIYLISGLYSEDTGYFLERMRIKLVFLFLPFAFWSLPRLERKTYYSLLLYFFYLMSAICLAIIINFLLHYGYYLQIYKEGRIMPTPIQHIRFSLLVCVAVVTGVYLLLRQFYLRFRWERHLIAGLTIFMLAFLHLLAVRSGLLALYTVLFYFAIYFLFQAKRYWLAGLLLVGIAATGFLAANYLPTLKNKISYMRYSVDLFLKNENIRELSDSRRLASIQAGLEMGTEHPLTGVGVGDIRKGTNDYLRERYPELADLGLLPHNQFVFVFAATGLIGLLCFFICIILPFFYRRAYTDLFFTSVQLIFFTSFLTEHTLETQIGTASYLFFTLLSLTAVDQGLTIPRANSDR